MVESLLGNDLAINEIEAGIALSKCQQCGCMGETLEQIQQSLPALNENRTVEFRLRISGWQEKMKAIRYACLGCDHCYAGAAQNAFTATFPENATEFGLKCEIQSNAEVWPPVAGEYFVVDPSAPIAVTTLSSLTLAGQLAGQKLPGLAIVGKLETENIGLDKLIKNVIANPNLRFLIISGVEPAGHLSGQTLLALAENGLDENNRVIGSKGKKPILRNVSRAEIETFRQQMRVVDLIGCESLDRIGEKIAELRALDRMPVPACACTDSSCGCQAKTQESALPSVVWVSESDVKVRLDRAGYFVILPVLDRKVIHVEHYDYENVLLHVVEGATARSLYLAILEQGWVSEMSHAAYLGKELAKAEMSLAFGIPYQQDAA